jgi:hypothetical protein
MAFERTYQHIWNAAAADNSSLARLSASELWFILATLTGNLAMTDINGAAVGTVLGKWSIAGTGNGSAGAMDAVDRINLVTFTAANWTNGTAGNPHTWACLHAPASGFGPNPPYLLVSWSSASGTNYARFAFCKTAPTGGSSTADPTTTDATSALDKPLNDGTLNYVFSAKLSTLGDLEAYAQKTGSGQAFFACCLWYLAQANAADTMPYGLYAEYNASAPGVISANGIRASSNWAARYTDNSGANATSASNFAAKTISGMENVFASSGDAQDGSIMDFPFFLLSNHTSLDANATRRGRLPDIFLAGLDGTSVNNGKVNPVPPTQPTTTLLGSFCTPANAAPAL